MPRPLYILLLLLLPICMFAQTEEEQQQIRQKRFQWIHVHHIGVGFETNMYENVHIAPRLYYSFGSFRNLCNLDGGLRYVYIHPMRHVAQEKVAGHYLSPFVAATLNFGRWNNGCVYAGGEFAYNFAVAGDHYLPTSTIIVKDKSIAKNHGSVKAKLGVKMEEWEVNIHYEYDLAPAVNQKYIFESADYDYELLRPTLYERHRIGVTVSYLFPF